MKNSRRIRIYKYENWGELRSFIDDLVQKCDFMWRGHSSHEWKLCSSLFRYFESSKTVSSMREKLERKAIETFENSIRTSNPNIKLNSSVMSMAYMQHFGCPTRILDWSRSPYVALYFAILDAQEYPTIYALDINGYQNSIASKLVLDDYDGELLTDIPNRYYRLLKKESRVNFPIPLIPNPINVREKEQQSVYLLDMQIEKATEDMFLPNSNRFVLKIQFSKNPVKQIFRHLTLMNIDGEHLFEGFQGYAFLAKEQLHGLDSFGESTKMRVAKD